MKVFAIALAAFAMSIAASAAQVGPESSWQEIQQAGFIAGFPTINFATEGVTVDELCIDGDNLRPVQPNKTTCAQYDWKFNHCVRYETTYLSTPRTHKESRCVKYNHKGDDCVAYESYLTVYPTAYEISVYKETPRAGLTEVFKKHFEIPACQQ